AEKTLGFEFADILIVKEKTLCLTARRGYSKISSLELPLDGEKGITVRVARTGEPVFVPDISKDDAYVEGGLQTRSELAVPIKIGNKVVGVLNAERKEVNAFDEKDRELLEILASHAATAISNLDRAKKLEENAREIQENQRKLERLFVNIPEACVYMDLNLHILEINPRFCELFGYSLDEVKGKNIDDVVVPRDKIDEAKMLGEELLKGRAHCETARQRKDGTLVPVSISVAPVVVEDQPTGYVGLYSDITERKRYEERLSALNIYSYDLNMAGSMGEIYGLTLDVMQKVLGFEYADFFMIEGSMLRIVDQRGYPKPFPLELPLDESKKGISIRAVTIGNSVSVKDVRSSADFVEGLPDILSELAVPIKIGQKILGVLNVESKKLNAFDEKDRELLEILASHAATAISNLDRAKKLEENAREIRESQQKFEGLFMANPEAAVHVGPDICILNVNPRFEMLFGYRLDEIKGKNLNDVVVPKDKIDEAQMLDRIAEREKHVSQNTVRRKKDGSLVPVFVSSAPITVEGRFLGYVAVYKDISELKHAENKLELMNEKLRVTGGLTRHDVRNKLSTVTGNVYMLKKRLADNSDALGKLKAIDNAVQQTVRIFDFAKAYEMLGIEELSYIDVAKTLDDAVSLFPSSINVKVVNECHGLAVLADPLLRQLFYNLIDNSLRHGQKVSRIRLYYEVTDLDNLTLVYEDDGVGIPASEKPNLFQQGYSTGGSTGYGLYLISKMVEVYGWTIQETGTSGKGARFTMAIPKAYRDGRESAHVSALVNP
ncbi:MAG TPA: PAS domain S-box protein, partial [Candidatus Bathyarchaeia archaeon]|nr:PAS domain S-box protein [Candidatus Bathyarchaeia archaeon]